jgi:hypothetical protein
MRNSTLVLLLTGLCFSASILSAGTVSVEASATFNGGLLGDWSFQYVSGAPGLYLESITIDLDPANLYFDTAAGGFGSLASENVCCFAGTDATTGLTDITVGSTDYSAPFPNSALGTALDGGQVVTFNFTAFAPGDTFSFQADVDHPDPTLTPLRNCTGLKALALVACNAANATITAANNVALLAAQTVLSGQMAGATVTYTFGGTDYYTGASEGTFQAPTLGDILRGDTGSTLGILGDVQTPEPGTIAMLGAGLAALGLLRLRRRS